MEYIISSSEIASDNQVVSLVFHNSLQRVIRDLKLTSISMLTCGGLGFGFGASDVVVIG